MSTTVRIVQYSVHKGPGSKPVFWCKATIVQSSMHLQPDFFISGYCLTVGQSSMHQRPDFTPGFWCQVAVRLLYDLPYIKDLILRQGFDVRRLSDSCTIFHDPKTWLHARVLMSGDWQTVVQPPITRDLASFQGFNALATVRHLYDLLCTKYPALSQHFNVVCCWCCLLLDVQDKQYVLMSCDCQTIVQFFMHQRPELRLTKRARVEYWLVCLPNASARPSARSRSRYVQSVVLSRWRS